MTVGITELPPEGMQLGGVALAGDATRGTKTTEGLSLLFTTAGITVQGPQPQIERLLVWSGLDSASCREKIDLPDGRNAVVMELTSGGQSIRFLLPLDAVTPGQAAYLDQALPAWLARYKGSRVPAATAPRTAAVGAATGAGNIDRGGHFSDVGDPTVASRSTPDARTAPPLGQFGSDATSGAAAGAAVGVGSTANGTVREAAPVTAPPPPPPAPSMTPPPPPPPAAPLRFPTPSRTATDGALPTPPAEPPVNPVPLSKSPPPPPPVLAAEAAALATPPLEWKPPIDPVTGEPAWDQSPPLKSPTKKHRWKRGAKADAVAAAGAGAAASALALSERDRTVAESTPEVAPTPDESPADTILPPGAGFEAPVLADDAKPKNNRNLLVVLLVVLVLAVAGIAYFAVKRHSDNTTTPTVASTPAVTPTHTASDRVLATSINLRGTDLPAGWRAIPATAQAPLPAPAVPAAAQVAAVGALSSCLGQPFSLLAGLFGNGSAPGLSASATSPMFQSGADPGISMVSTTSVMTTVAANRVLAAPFANPNFVACFTRYQTQLASAVVPGSTASVQTVTLPSPAGVTTFAYLTTSTLPGKGTYVLGEAFMFGGRVESRLVPSTNGPAVPQAAFAQAYDGVSGRVARAVRT